MSLRRLLLISLLLAACASPGDGQIDVTHDPCGVVVLAVDGPATDAERASLDDASALWRAVGITALTTEPVRGAPRLPVRFEAAAANFHGVYEDEIGVIYLNTALMDPAERAVTLSHEIGHAFGLLHVDRDERTSVMNRGNLHTVPSPDDATALAALWGRCSPR